MSGECTHTRDNKRKRSTDRGSRYPRSCKRSDVYGNRYVFLGRLRTNVRLHDLQNHAKKWCSENQRKPTFERKLSTESEDRDQTGSSLEAKAPRWFTDNIQSGRGVKRSMSEESDDYTYIPPKMDLLSQEQRVKSPWTKLLRKQLALDWEKNIEERRHEFERR